MISVDRCPLCGGRYADDEYETCGVERTPWYLPVEAYYCGRNDRTVYVEYDVLTEEYLGNIIIGASREMPL